MLRLVRPLGSLALVALVLAACAAPPPVDEPIFDNTPATVETATAANGICPDIPYFLQDNVRANFSLAAEFYRNANSADESNEAARIDAFCAAHTYLTWLTENEPLYTGGEPDDRNFLRLGRVYEFYSTQVDEEDERRAYLDSTIITWDAGVAAMRAANVQYDQYLRDLNKGYFYFSHASAYEDASRRQYDAFNDAFEAKPDSLEDWYLQQLFTLSAEFYEDPIERADYIDTLIPYMEDAAYAQYATQIAEISRTPPADPTQALTPNAIETLLAMYDADPQSLSADERRNLFAAANQLPDLVTEAGGDPDAIQDTYFDDIVGEILANDPDRLSASQYYALFNRSWRRGDRDQAEQYFNEAIAKAGSNAQKADYYYARASAGQGSRSSLYQQALSFQPSHGPTLYAQAAAYANGVGRPSSVEGRAAFWCVADRFNRVAASGDPRVASRARRAAAQYNRSGPSREDYFFKGWSPGQTIRASSGSVSCSTRVR